MSDVELRWGWCVCVGGRLRLLGRSVICGQAARVVFGDRLQGVGGVDGF